MDKFKKFFIFYLCFCIAFFPFVSSLVVHAEGNNYNLIFNYSLPSSPIGLTSEGYAASSLYVSGYNPPFFSNDFLDDESFVDFYNKLSNIPTSLGTLPVSYPNFCILISSYYIEFLFFNGISEHNLILCNNSQLVLRLDSNSSYRKVLYNKSNSELSVSVDDYSQLGYSLWGSGSYDGVYTLSRENNCVYVLSNMPIYYFNSSGDVKIQYNNNSSNFVDVNYMNSDSWNTGSETANNNLYMDSSKWSFDIPYYSLDQSGSTYGTGSATFSGSLNDYQINNSSEFTLEFLFTTFLSGYRYSWAQDSEKEDFSYKYIYSTDIPLSDFYNNGQVASFNINDIFENSISVNPTHLGYSVNDDCSRISNSQAVNLNNWYTTFTVAIKSSDSYSGKCSSMYSYLLRKSKTTDNSMQTNNNPFTGEEGSNSVPDSDIFNGESAGGSAGNSNSTANIGDYSVVNNNNPNITINNNNDNGFTNSIENGDSDGLLSKLLLLLANNQSTTSTGLSEIADTDGYVQVMGSVFTAVPVAWWSTLTVAFVACIGILVVSFVIKIILKFVI